VIRCFIVGNSRGRKIGLALVSALWLSVISLESEMRAMAFDLQGHRGARGLAPENTLAGFERALAIGVSTLETDLAVTRDDHVVLSHDPSLNPAITRAPDGRWLAGKGPAIRTLTLPELQRFDVGRIDPASAYARQFPDQRPHDGARIPTLAALFDLGEASGKPPRYNIETKISPLAPDETPDPDTFARLVVDEVRRADLQSRVTIQSFDWRTLLAVKGIAPEIATVCLTMDTPDWSNLRGAAGGPSPWLAGLDAGRTNASAPELAKAAGCSTWSPYWRNLDAAAVETAHGLGLKVIPWTVNDPTDMAAVIALGVDGLISDYPDRARAVLEEFGVVIAAGR
jgi:glycerophosphoryl diester phosphodiesterase